MREVRKTIRSFGHQFLRNFDIGVTRNQYLWGIQRVSRMATAWHLSCSGLRGRILITIHMSFVHQNFHVTQEKIAKVDKTDLAKQNSSFTDILMVILQCPLSHYVCISEPASVWHSVKGFCITILSVLYVLNLALFNHITFKQSINLNLV